MNKNVCYTCIVGKYDSLKDPIYITEGWDYICYTDNENFKSDIWEIRYLPDNISNLDNSRKNRYIKINPHKIFPEYEFSLYLDGTMKPTGNLNVFKNTFCNNYDTPLYLIPHGKRNCIYQEFFACAEKHKDNINIMMKQCRKYHEEGFPYDYGLSHNCVLARYHNNQKCIDIMNIVWEEITTYSLRDQLSLFYAIWKTNNKSNVIMLNRNSNLLNKFFDYKNCNHHDLK